MNKRVVIAGGGTGGHLYPGIALARALQKSDANMQISFIGTQNGIESKVLPKEGYPLKTILSAGLLGKKGSSRIKSLVKLPVGLLQAMSYLAKPRASLVVGVGGYVSGPAVLAAWILRIPTLIHEQNSLPGMTNRLLGKIVDKVAISFEESKSFFPANKVTWTGNMIREEFSQTQEPGQAKASEEFTLLILGGSQGAHSINMAMQEALPHLQLEREKLRIVHQTGEQDCDHMQRLYEENNFSADVRAFFHDMADQVRRADLILCRAGATTIAEITACGKASILVPFPFAANNHQEKNAQVLQSGGAGEMILDRDLNGERLSQSIRNAMQNPEQLQETAQNSYRLGNREATENVKQLCLQLLRITPLSESTAKNNIGLSCI
jgi:UDP-N-acetylglucosamine--N-acetylmuramyl-(pentapeptide) pyrophosphoryl-undecaprenol N-acetylglucosamine transferase